MEKSLRATSIEGLSRLVPDTLLQALGIEFTRAGPDFIEARMPVDRRTRQPHGLLHGGASAALAETLASVGAHLAIDPAQSRCVGIELNVSHLAGAREGWVVGVAKPLRLGRTLQVWEARISDEAGRLICVGRLTLAVVPVSPPKTAP
jgi:1,4-dihydroxy-2-naphthoyl-CoA hydrolase